MKKPLSHIKVLDLTRLLPGPLCTLYLADLGAEVIKIEDPKVGDYARDVLPKKKDNSIFFLMLNRNKKSLTLDLTKDEGREIFYKLARESDVLIESFRPGVTNKLKIDYQSIKKINSKLIYCSLTGYGQTGPYKNSSGHDINYLAYSGVLDQIGDKNERPSLANVQIADCSSSFVSCIAILSALLDVNRGGEGRSIDISMTDSALSLSMIPFSFLQGWGTVPNRGEDFLSGGTPCYNVYQTKDNKFVALGAFEKKFWIGFCQAIDREDLIGEHLAQGDRANQLSETLKSIFKAHDRSYWVDKFKDRDFCFSPVLNLKESLSDQHLKEREMFVESVHPHEGKIKHIACPIKMDGYQFEIEKEAPLKGEDSADILHDLGYSRKEIEKLYSDHTND